LHACRNKKSKKRFCQKSRYFENKQIFQIFLHLYVFIRILKRLKEKQTREGELSKRLDKVEERINYIQRNLNNKFDDLPTFTKIQGFFNHLILMRIFARVIVL